MTKGETEAQPHIRGLGEGQKTDEGVERARQLIAEGALQLWLWELPAGCVGPDTRVLLQSHWFCVQSPQLKSECEGALLTSDEV